MTRQPTYRPGLGDDTGRAVLHAHGHLEYRFAPGGTCEIVNIEVDGSHRREGVGRWLVYRLFEAARGRARLVYAITRTDNRTAQQFYEELRFKVAGVLRDFYADGNCVDAIMYARDLESLA